MNAETNRNKTLKYVIWLLFSVPALFTFVRYLIDRISYGQVIHETGDWSVAFLGATLAATPFIRLWPKAGWTTWLMRHRRALGVASFGYAAFHTVAYLERKWGYGYILEEAQQPGILTGWIALAIFVVLAVTSNNYSLRMLKRSWQKLHRLVYPAAALVFAHWILTAFEPLTAYVTLGAFCAVESMRFLKRRAPSSLS